MTTMAKQMINVCKDYYVAPVGRFPEDHTYNGERFRNELLVPALREGGEVLVDLDGTDGFGSSFLEEAFGGLVRVCGFTADDLERRLTIKSDEDASFIEEIWGYIRNPKRAVGRKR